MIAVNTTDTWHRLFATVKCSPWRGDVPFKNAGHVNLDDADDDDYDDKPGTYTSTHCSAEARAAQVGHDSNAHTYNHSCQQIRCPFYAQPRFIALHGYLKHRSRKRILVPYCCVSNLYLIKKTIFIIMWHVCIRVFVFYLDPKFNSFKYLCIGIGSVSLH